MEHGRCPDALKIEAMDSGVMSFCCRTVPVSCKNLCDKLGRWTYEAWTFASTSRHHLHISVVKTTAVREYAIRCRRLPTKTSLRRSNKLTLFAARLHPSRPTIRAIRGQPLEICTSTRVCKRLRRLTAISPRISTGFPRVHSEDRHSDTTQCLELFVPAAGFRRVTGAIAVKTAFWRGERR